MRVDFTDRAMETLELTRELLWFEQILMLGTRVAHDKVANGTSLSVVISPDRETIYTTGMKHETIQQSGSCENKSTPFGVRAIRAEDSRLLLEMDVYANQLSIASDGSRLFLTGWR